MPLLDISGHPIINDAWIYLDEYPDALVDHNQYVIVSSQDFFADYQKCYYHFSCGGRLGMEVTGKTNLSDFEASLPILSMIVANFPSFTDGRGFSQATYLLRQDYHGGLRAKGWLLPDQRGPLSQCGFDSIELDDNIYLRHGTHAWESLDNITLTYQQGFHQTQKQSIMQNRWQNK